MELTIYHTNDIHSRFQSFFKLASYLKEHKTNDDILVDAGDFIDFSQPIMMGSDGKAGMKLLSALNYDALCLGNNETFAGLDMLKNLADGKTNIISCNIEDELHQRIPKVHKHIIIQKKGIRILIMGISPYNGNYNDFSSMLNVYSTHPNTIIKETLATLKGQYDICIIVSHIGIEDDIQLANDIEGIDVIIGGHSHTKMKEALFIHQTLIYQAGQYGEYIGKLTLTYENQSIVAYSSKLIETKDMKEDEAIKEMYYRLENDAFGHLDKPLFELKQPLTYELLKESALINFINDALYHTYTCDFAIMNSGIANFTLAGNISKKKMLECVPSHLNPTHMKIRGQQFYDALIQSLDDKHCILNGRGAGFRGTYIGRLYASHNVKITITSTLQVYVDDVALDMEKEYHVVTSDYLQRGSGYSSLASEQDVSYEAGYIRDMLLETLTKEVNFKYVHEQRWTKGSSC